MPIAIATKQIKDGAGSIFLQRAVDISGTGAGPFIPVFYWSSADGANVLDPAAMFQSVIDAIEAAAAGPSFADSGVAAIQQDFIAGGSTSSLAVKAGRDAMLEVSGAGAADLQVEIRLDGANWRPLYAPDGATQLFRIAYAGVPFATFLPALPVAGARWRVTDLAHGAGTVTVRLSQ